MERIVGHVEIERDTHRRLAVRIHELIDEQPLDGPRIVVELVMPIEPDLARVLQSVQRRLAGQRLIRLKLLANIHRNEIANHKRENDHFYQLFSRLTERLERIEIRLFMKEP